MGRGKVRMEEDDLKARGKLKDKEDRTGRQRAKDQGQPALGQGLEEGGKLVTECREKRARRRDTTHE